LTTRPVQFWGFAFKVAALVTKVSQKMKTAIDRGRAEEFSANIRKRFGGARGEIIRSKEFKDVLRK